MPTFPTRLPTCLLFLAALLPMAPAVRVGFQLQLSAPNAAQAWTPPERSASSIIARAGDLEVRPAQGTVVQGTGKACASSEDYLRDLQLVARRDGDVINLEVTTPGDAEGHRPALRLPRPDGRSAGGPARRDPGLERRHRSARRAGRAGARTARVTSSCAASPATSTSTDSSGDVHVAKAAGRVQVQRQFGRHRHRRRPRSRDPHRQLRATSRSTTSPVTSASTGIRRATSASPTSATTCSCSVTRRARSRSAACREPCGCPELPAQPNSASRRSIIPAACRP